MDHAVLRKVASDKRALGSGTQSYFGVALVIPEVAEDGLVVPVQADAVAGQVRGGRLIFCCLLGGVVVLGLAELAASVKWVKKEVVN